MSEPPVTITTYRTGATAHCHRCIWASTVYDHPGATSAAERVSARWADHWRNAHTEGKT